MAQMKIYGITREESGRIAISYISKNYGREDLSNRLTKLLDEAKDSGVPARVDGVVDAISWMLRTLQSWWDPPVQMDYLPEDDGQFRLNL